MKWKTVIPATALALVAALATTAPASAQRFHRGWHHGGWHHGGGGWFGPMAGFAAGALLGSELANPYYGPGYAYGYPPAYAYSGPADNGAIAYCQQRFKSYDPTSGTYLGYDGNRHSCP